MKYIKIIDIVIAMFAIILLMYVWVYEIGTFPKHIYRYIERAIPEPTKPEITYGEFDFKLTYEVDGKTKTIEDTIICEFDGFEWLGESGKYRKWKSKLKSGNDEIVLLDLRDKNEINEYGNTMLELIFYWGNAEFYMGDEITYMTRRAQNLTEINYRFQAANGRIGSSAYGADVALERYGIRLIKWECDEPIKNTFR